MSSVLPDEILIGGKLQYNSLSEWVAIHKAEFNGISYAHENENKKLFSELLEFSVLSNVKAIGFENCRINIVDFNIDSSYYRINRFKKIDGFVNTIKKADLESSLDAIETYASELNSEYLQNKYPSICDYNMENLDDQLSYNIIILNLDNFEVSSNNVYSTLLKLLKGGKRLGVVFYFLFNGEDFAKDIVEDSKNTSFSNKNRLEFLTEISKTTAVFYKHKGVHKIQNTNQKLANALRNFSFVSSESDFDTLIIELEAQINRVEDSDNIKDFISIPIGKSGKQIFNFEMGLKSACYHAFIGGQTGMGKSNLINNIIVQVAEMYSPEHLQLQLIDLKGLGGTEFQFYKDHPNVEKLVLSSKPDVSVKVIEDFVKEIDRRSELLKSQGVKNIYEYNEVSSEKLQYKLMIIDEVQKLFITSRQITNQFNAALDRIVREGRGFGIHILISTQSLSQVEISKTILEQIKLRISFQLQSYIECAKIMNSNNEEPLAIKPYEVIYNKSNGNVKSNKKFKTIEIKTNDIKKRLQVTRKKNEAHLTPIIYDNSFDLHNDKTVNSSIKSEKMQPESEFFKGEVDLDSYAN